ncbi:MAG: TolC family protein [Chitinophagaceae bacterium]|nr:TolC family protein [Chitinophagaceae bacterium]
MRRILTVIPILCFIQAQGQPVLSVEEAIAAGLKNNYDILLAKNEAEALAIDYQYANGAFLPQLEGSAGKVWNRNNSQQDFLDGRKRKANVSSGNLTAAVNLNWTVFDGLKMFATKARLDELRGLGELNVKTQAVNSIAAIIANYYNIVRQKQQLKAIDELISINEERVKLADKKLSVGMGSKPELLQARVDLNAQKASRLLQETLIAQLKETLNQLTAMPAQAEYEVSDSIPLHLGIQYDSIRSGIEQVNPALLAAKKNIGIAELSLKERKAELWPKLSFNSAYNFGRVNNASVINPEFQPIFNMTKGLNYGVSASVPLLTGFNTRRLIKQAGLEIQYRQLSYDNQQRQMDVSINNAYKDYQYQKKALQLEEENISLAKENVFIALERFRQGVSTYLELREAQISLEDAYNRLIAARYNTKLAETELFRLKGVF